LAEGVNNPLAALGAAFATALTSPMIDAFVTPASLALILNGVKPDPGAPATVALPSENDVETTEGYGDLNTFLVTVKAKGSTGSPVGLVLKRSGLASWKLSALTFQ
ncbi:MAG TPA: hypothetical protein VF395_07290, partial [Polyangiaceae bacterium]